MLHKQEAKYLAMGALVACLGFTSCVDDKYDLDNVDMTLGSDVDLNLPACSTGDILLTNIIDLEEDGIVQLVDNPNGDGEMYAVCENGAANIDPINIGEIKIAKPTICSFDSHVNLKEVLQGTGSGARKAAPRHVTVNLDGGVPINVPDETYKYELTLVEGKTSIDQAYSSSISEDICKLENIKCEKNAMTMVLNVSGMPDYVGNLHLDNFRLTLPIELHICDCTIDGVSIASLENITNDGVNQTLQLTPAQGLAHSLHTSLTLKVYFDEAWVENASAEAGTPVNGNLLFDAEKHEMKFTGSLGITGVFRLETSEMDPDGLSNAIKNELKNWTAEDLAGFVANPDLSKLTNVIPESLHFTGNNSFDKDIVLTSVTGDFKHNVGAIDPIKLDDLPDFMNDDDVVLDLDNPMIFISTSTDLPAEATITTAITLKSIKNGQTVERHTRGVNLEGDKVFWLANRKEMIYMPKDEKGNTKYFNPEYTKLYEWFGDPGDPEIKFERDADVTGLIKMVPKQINIEVDEVRLHAEDLKIGQPYNVDVKYEIYAPLVFGEEFRLVYQDTETDFGIGDDVDDLTFSRDALIELTGEVTSTLPTKCTFTVTPLDKNGNVLSILNPVILSVDAKAQNAPITAKITPIEGHTINEVLHSGPNQLDGINYKAVLYEPVPDEGLTDSGSIVVKNIKLHVKSKVAYDAN